MRVKVLGFCHSPGRAAKAWQDLGRCSVVQAPIGDGIRGDTGAIGGSFLSGCEEVQDAPAAQSWGMVETSPATRRARPNCKLRNDLDTSRCQSSVLKN